MTEDELKFLHKDELKFLHKDVNLHNKTQTKWEGGGGGSKKQPYHLPARNIKSNL